jgi:peptidyl-prolyl cis-trans isomerase SurA
MIIPMPNTCVTLRLARRARRALLAALLVLATAAATMPADAQQVVVIVNGEPITALDIEQRSKFLQLTGGGKASSRQEVIDDLINEKLKLFEARKFKLTASDTEVEAAFGAMAARAGATPEQLTQKLVSAGAGAGTLKSRIRADIVWAQLVRGRFQQTLQVGEKDVLSALETRKKDDKDAGYEYTLRPILFIVPKGSPPTAFEARRREAEALKARFQSCEEGIAFARALKDVAVRTQVIKNSADLPAPLRSVLDSMQVGRLTNPDQTPQGIEVFALCAKSETKADSPGKREVREEIFAKRFQAQATQYLKQIRGGAMIEYR